MKQREKTSGFTIIELLIVIVVIAILATITIIAYNGIQSRAQVATVRANLSSYVKKIETYKTTDANSLYPTSLSQAGITDTSGVIYSVDGNNQYCIMEAAGSVTYSVSSAQSLPSPGLCGSTYQYALNGNVNDSVNGANGTATNLTYGTGQSGAGNSAGVFSGSSYIQLPSSNLLPLPMSISAWVYPTSFGSGEGVMVVGADPGVRLIIGTTGNLWASVNISSNWYYIYGGPVNLNQWNHLVITVSSSTAITYINGALDSNVSLPGGAINYNTSTPNVIGADNYISSSYHDNFVGKIQDVSFYNRVLGLSDVQSMYAAGAQ